MRWGDLTWPEIEECARQDYTVILPCGTIEQHGLHLPVDTDTDIANTIAERVAGATPKTLTLPTLWIGLSPHHTGFPGTISFSFNTYGAVLKEIAEGVQRSGFKRLVFLNAHGGNQGILQGRALGLMDEIGMNIMVITYWHLIKDAIEQHRKSEIGGMHHACEFETAVELHLRPELVRMEKAVKNLNRPKLSYAAKDMASGGAGFIAMPYRKESGYGVKGDPTVATPETGAALLDAVVTRLSAAIREYQELPLS